MAVMDIRVSDLTHNITLRVRGLRLFSWRCRMAARIFRLGARVAGVGIVIEQEPQSAGR